MLRFLRQPNFSCIANSLRCVYNSLSSACLTIGATVVILMPRAKQYFDCNQTDNFFCPLLALQPQQQRAIFSRVMIVASLIMCSQLAADFRVTCGGVNLIPQYTQALSLSRTSFSSQSGMFHLLAISGSIFTYNVVI